jgi:hypothetical protein
MSSLFTLLYVQVRDKFRSLVDILQRMSQRKVLITIDDGNRSCTVYCTSLRKYNKYWTYVTGWSPVQRSSTGVYLSKCVWSRYFYNNDGLGPIFLSTAWQNQTKISDWDLRFLNGLVALWKLQLTIKITTITTTTTTTILLQWILLV